MQPNKTKLLHVTDVIKQVNDYKDYNNKNSKIIKINCNMKF